MGNISQFQYAQMVERLNRVPRVTDKPPVAGDKPLESKLHYEIMEFCDHQWPRWKYVRSRMDKPTTTEVGVSDFIIAMPEGRTVYIEAKRRGRKLKPAQAQWAAEMKMLGHTVHVVYCMNDFFTAINHNQNQDHEKERTEK